MMRYFLNISLLMFVSIIGLCSCSKEDSPGSYYYDDPTIYSSSKIQFSEVVFFLKPYLKQEGVKKYIVTDKLYNVSLKINNRIKALSDSYQLDTLHIASKETVGIYSTTTENIHYPLVMNINVTTEKMTTAGQYSDLLNNYLTLSPGAYVCQIESFDIKDVEGNLHTIYTPTLSVSLVVKENTFSSNLGEFDIVVK